LLFSRKSKSPSCGLCRVKLYRDKDGRVLRGFSRGVFADQVLRRYRDYPVEDEYRLRNPHRRLRFLLLMFALAQIRTVQSTDLFHSGISPVLRTFTPLLERRMARERNPSTYRILFLRAARRVPLPALALKLAHLIPPPLHSSAALHRNLS
jgi:hypothetical protein